MSFVLVLMHSCKTRLRIAQTQCPSLLWVADEGIRNRAANVSSAPNIQSTEQEMDKFVLLPAVGDTLEGWKENEYCCW